MTKFEQELKNNNLVCSHCSECNKFVWPPSDFCNNCFGPVTWIPLSRKARLIEFSCKDSTYFCVAEFESGIRLMGTLESKSDLNIGQSIVLIRCSHEKTEEFVFGLVES